ncbi:chemotaxis protein CheX [Pseudobacteroides cellulosolvens]|uniref:Putative chemotaxis phosphatase, CheX n=1 Tax=Pseudobacteroides cellulosolvens ATCC 35603 = DSM 2933 TaxID=398512 RepID=A0A0L6JVI3_9FIRM|nr:chemotaxis protein CheX [Pseudobacteroides cellulosolvens]KNY29714.1 putative chemotaxis phosphatase, CheX [Pseudobacteroides cellulosolvens ATCC 35603 = DSM 2933]
MDIKYINPFLQALVKVLGEFGISDVTKSGLKKKEKMHVDMDITSVIGLIGGARGNIAYSFSEETAKKIASAMMMGEPVETMDALSRSAISELTNMVTGTACGILSENGLTIDLTPPSLIFGKDIYFIISSVETICLEMNTGCGKVEINIGLEM